MGIFEGIKSTFNISGVEIKIITEDQIYSQADTINGEVIFKGGNYQQNGNSISLQLLEFWTETRTTGANPPSTTTVTVTKSHETVLLTKKFSIEPDEEFSFPFQVRLPLNSRISTRGTGWKLYVTLDIPNAIDPSGSLILKVEPAEELQAIVDTCEMKMRFEEQPKYRCWSPSTGCTSFRFDPPQILKSELDYLRMDLKQNTKNSVTGELVFDLQEKSLKDYLKAMINFDQITKPFNLTKKNIFNEDHTPDYEKITKAITKRLEEVLKERNP